MSGSLSGSGDHEGIEIKTAHGGKHSDFFDPHFIIGRHTMDLGHFIWLFFILAMLQPVIRQRLLEASRQRLIARIEEQRKSRLILLVHRQETMSLLGFPFFRYIDVNDSEEVIRAIHMTDKDMPLDLVLHTPGGLVLAATQIARAIQRHRGKVTVFVPHYAMSGGTLIALAADEIVMCEHAVLGPVDPQIGQYPAASILAAVKQKPLSEVDDQTLILADQAQKAIDQMKEEVRELLAEKFPIEKADELARLLASGTWTHDYPITYERARSLGLPVSRDMPEEILRLMQLYPQPVRRQPTVEYVPSPRGTRRASRGSGI
jgi:ClpP class serine protease